MGDDGGGVTSHIMTVASRHFHSQCGYRHLLCPTNRDKQNILGYPRRWLISSLVTTTLSTAVNSDRTLAYQFDNTRRVEA